MHPFPPADEFQCLIGDAIERVCFNAFLTQFNFGGSTLVLEHRLAHVEPDGTRWDYDCVAEGSSPLVLHRLVGKRVVAIDREALHLTLTFEDNARLIAFSEIGPYESGQFDAETGRYLVF